MRISKNKKRMIPVTKFKEQSLCKCTINCANKIDVVRQKELFEAYYKYSSHAQKVLIMRESVITHFVISQKKIVFART